MPWRFLGRADYCAAFFWAQVNIDNKIKVDIKKRRGGNHVLGTCDVFF